MPTKIRSLCIAVSVALMALLAPTASAQFILFGWKISEFQPDIANGGRANTISVNPANNDIILVASETGGLFRSSNRGVSWKHLDGLPEFSTSAVAFVPDDPTVVIDIARKSHEEGFIKGFAVIQSPAELDIVAVYTAAPSIKQPVVALDVERVPGRPRR